MKVKVLMVGSTDKSYLREGIDIYLKRLGHYLPVEWKELPDVKRKGKWSVEIQKQKEAEMILKQLSTQDHLILLDERGKSHSSPDFAKWIEQKQVSLPSTLVFLVGGPYGFSQDVRQRSSGSLSLSKMTFSHQMIRLFFVEQLYRAMTILKGEPYHHDG